MILLMKECFFLGQVIYLEVQRFLRVERMRSLAYQLFSWKEMEALRFLEPMIRFWSQEKQHILSELLYRSAFEIYFFGMMEAKKAQDWRRSLSSENSWDSVYLRFFQEKCHSIIQGVINDFTFFRWLEEWRVEALFILLQGLACSWFVKGVQGAAKIKINRCFDEPPPSS
jgi:hypothetical protein